LTSQDSRKGQFIVPPDSTVAVCGIHMMRTWRVVVYDSAETAVGVFVVFVVRLCSNDSGCDDGCESGGGGGSGGLVAMVVVVVVGVLR
jgi:hypothetical protein